eukprot:gnl/MRDRNA2_/MRDRNA2_95766_c0_seq1.p1 gnl/MRDRNA2_/MRDRNA2_95766_c0~~gnl/MRDRNA2_/MRDRNA2_95766_c0_seq1.p1  ORF type:complete len:144 (+),score=28.36 gnl/MRDRNA2_/MRDRNA2_95766_c0_seq1:91-522(+)
MASDRKAISKAEVEKHNTDKDCWIIVHDLVLDLSADFLNEHPGGPEVITSLAGKDVTSDYEDIAHSDSARDWTNKFIIGYVEGAKAPEATPDGVDPKQLDPKTKKIPTSQEVSSSGGGGGGMGILPIIIGIVMAGVAYLMFKK